MKEKAKEKVPVPVVIVREPEVRKRTKLSRTTRWRMMRSGDFPNSVKLAKRAIGWIEADVDAWLEKLKPCTTATDASESK